MLTRQYSTSSQDDGVVQAVDSFLLVLLSSIQECLEAKQHRLKPAKDSTITNAVPLIEIHFPKIMPLQLLLLL